MLKILKILVTAHALVGGAAMLTACGQKASLFLPSTPESVGRATLPQALKLWPKTSATVPVTSDAPTESQAASDTAPSNSANNTPLTAPAAPVAPSK